MFYRNFFITIIIVSKIYRVAFSFVVKAIR